jgi:pimeloyl-ACP methyl ester carboxylesterase
MKRFFVNALLICTGVYIVVCVLLYFLQERLIFFPQKLDSNHQFQFDQKLEEMSIKAPDGKVLNGVLFKTETAKGLIFYLHGNAGSISSWGSVAETYTDLDYDVFLLDYRGYGKSEGTIGGQAQLFGDVQAAYDALKQHYSEDKIIVLGYSIGTGPAARIASTNKPRMLILQAPYDSLTDVMRQKFPILPTFILRYKFETNLYLKDCSMPVVIFHGDQDGVIPFDSSLRLKAEFKVGDRLIALEGEGHNGMTDNADYQKELSQILNR